MLSSIRRDCTRTTSPCPCAVLSRRDRRSTWNGVLFLNARRPLRSAAGAAFHRRRPRSGAFLRPPCRRRPDPFDATAIPITLKKTSVFGLIDYIDTVDLVPEKTVPFAFRTMQLTAASQRASRGLRKSGRNLAQPAVRRVVDQAGFAARQQPVDRRHLAARPRRAVLCLLAHGTEQLRRAERGDDRIEITAVQIETLANPSATASPPISC